MPVLLRYTRTVYAAFKEVNGKFKVNTSSTIGRMHLNDESMNFLADYINFVMNSGIISKATRIYITSIEDNLINAIRAYNYGKSELEQIQPRQAYNQVNYDTTKLLKLFPDDMITNIIYKRADLDVYNAMLQAAINKKTKKSILTQATVLNIPYAFDSKRPTDEELDDFFVLIAPYTKNIICIVEDKLPKNVVGYINYISSKSKLTYEEKDILNRLKHLGDSQKEPIAKDKGV